MNVVLTLPCQEQHSCLIQLDLLWQLSRFIVSDDFGWFIAFENRPDIIVLVHWA